MSALEEVVARMESNELPLEETLRLFEHGARLARRCETLLGEAELRVEELNRALQQRADSS